MEVQEVLLARAIRLVKVSAVVGYWPDLLKDLGTRFSFAHLPSAEDVIASQNKGTAKGAEFQVGRLRRKDGSTIVIEKFTVFNDGLVADTRTSTDDCDIFLDSIEEWASSNLSGFKNVGRSLYLDQLEVKFNLLQSHEYAKVFNTIGEQVSSLLTEYGMPRITPYRFGSITMSMEPERQPALQPGVFQIERRQNIPFDENVYWAQAPLRTGDHTKLLEALEQLLANI
jgi:hypothetical protein